MSDNLTTNANHNLGNDSQASKSVSTINTSLIPNTTTNVNSDANPSILKTTSTDSTNNNQPNDAADKTKNQKNKSEI